MRATPSTTQRTFPGASALFAAALTAVAMLFSGIASARQTPADSATPQTQSQPPAAGTLTPAELLAQQEARKQAEQQARRQASPQSSITTLQANAHLVVLDVTVMDKQGHSLHGLQASDFTLLENGKPQTISSFEEHMPAQTPAASQALHLGPNTFTDYQPVPNNSAVNVLLLDALDTPIIDQMYLRGQMIKYLKTVAPGTPIAVFLLDTRLHLLQGFSSDPKVLQDFASGKHNMPEMVPLDGPQLRYMRQMILQEAMQQLSRYLGGLPGRKNLIWLTGNFPADLGGPGDNFGLSDTFGDTMNFVDSLMRSGDVLTLGRVAVYPVDVRGLMTDPRFSAANGNIGVAPRGGAAFSTRNAEQNSVMEQLANATGGKAFYNTNGLQQVISEIIDTGANYYTLSYSPTDKNWNGRFRSLKIQLDRQGYYLSYRQGYFAKDQLATAPRAAPAFHRRALPLPYKKSNPGAETAMQVAMDRGAIPPSQLLFKSQVVSTGDQTKKNAAAPLPKDNSPDKKLMKYPYRAYRVTYAVDARNLRFTATPDGIYHDSIEFVTILYDADGAVVNLVGNTVRADLDSKVYGGILQQGLNFSQTIAIPAKGNYFLRLGVHDISSNRIGALEIPVDSIKLGPIASATAPAAR